MKLKALANLSGPDGNVDKDEEFEAKDTLGKELVERKLAVSVDDKIVAKRKPAEGE